MSDAPERIWVENLNGNWRHNYNCSLEEEDNKKLSISKIEYIRKDIAFPRISKKDIDRLEVISMKQDAMKHIRAAMEEYENEKDLSDTDFYYLELFKQAIRADIEGK